jgi:hypothetical protein
MQGTAQSALLPLPTAIYGVLTATVAFTALSALYNDVPQGTPAPYTLLENFTETPWNTMREYGKDCTFELHVVSQARGDQEAIGILNAARAPLDYQTFAVTGFRLVECKYVSGDHWKEEAIAGVITRHHTHLYRVRLTQPS